MAMKAGGPRDRRLPRQRRLLTPAEFQRVRDQGRRWVHGCLIANWLPFPGRAYSRLGVVTSRKIGGAVIRNRARRLMRESFRHHQFELSPAVDLVLVARRSIATKNAMQVEKDFLTILNRARLIATPT